MVLPYALLHTVYNVVKHELLEQDNSYLLLWQSVYRLLNELLAILETLNQYTFSIQSNYASLYNSIIIRDHLYEVVTKSTSYCKALKDVKYKMHLSWDTRIPSMGFHNIADFLDPSLKYLRSLLNYIKTRKDTMSYFIQEVIAELGITI